MFDTKEISDSRAEPTSISSRQEGSPMDMPEPKEPKLTFMQKVKREYCTFGSAVQIITAALLAIAIGLPISLKVVNMPAAAPILVNIPGDLWLRALKAVGK